MSVPSNLQIGRVLVDLIGQRVFSSDGVEIPLRAQSFRVFRYLIEHAGRLVEKNELMEAGWPVPNVSLAMIRDLHPNADPEVLEREVAALRRIGLADSGELPVSQ